VRTDAWSGTRYIAVVSASDSVKREWGSRRSFELVYKDYALMKVLYMLSLNMDVSQGVLSNVRTRPRIPVRVFEYQEGAVVPLDFSGLQASDTIFIVGHGSNLGLYALGKTADKVSDRLVELLLGDGNLKKKRQGKTITILLLSCRAGLGFHKGVARRLLKQLLSPVASQPGHATIQADGTVVHNVVQSTAPKVIVGGALGFTFGSYETWQMGMNEVLIEGIPWRMEYPGSIPDDEADQKTSAREGKQITFDSKKAEITSFMGKKEGLENSMKGIIGKLKSTEVNLALNELETKFGSDWLTLIKSQFELYQRAKTVSNLEFDMWYDKVTEGYVWADGANTTDAEADALLAGDLIPVGSGMTSIK